ncbi:hypothetical protein [Streptomyces sp. NPDC051567]|uniref:hypothetical protein n=1 Tax=Streptomyces sp. NPDC051567 TaxID=3365660 RepID=UPI0037B1BA4F
MGTPPRTAARRAAPAVALAAFAALALSACSTPAPPSPAASPTPAPAPSSPARICAVLVSYWAGETLKGTTWSGLDWEQKGLSPAQYAIHEDAVAAGRAEERAHGRDAALALIDRFTARRCAEEDGATGSPADRPPAP